MSDWVSVKERLPDSDNDVIVFTETDEIEIGNYSYAKWLTSSYGKVVYWMPLPNKPNRKSKTKQNTCNADFEKFEEVSFLEVGLHVADGPEMSEHW